MEYVEDSYQVEGDGFGLPDTPHMEIMFDALNDHIDAEEVAGTEAFSMTPAMHYAHGVLASVGIVRLRQVSGNEEGFFSAIGDGFKAVYDWIVKTFKAIWDFFFSRDSAEEAETAKEAIDENVKELTAAGAGTQSEEEANKQLTAMTTAAGGEGGNKTVAEDLTKAKKGSLKEKREAIKAALKEMPKMNKKAVAKLEQTVQAAVKAKKAFNAGHNQDASAKEDAATSHLASSNNASNDDTMDMSNEVTKFALKDAHFIGVLEKATSISDVNGAIAFSKACSQNIDQLKAFSDIFKNKKSKIESLLASTQTKMKAAKEAKDKTELKKDVDALRTIVSVGVRTSKLIEANYHRITAASNDLNKVFGL